MKRIMRTTSLIFDTYFFGRKQGKKPEQQRKKEQKINTKQGRQYQQAVVLAIFDTYFNPL